MHSTSAHYLVHLFRPWKSPQRANDHDIGQLQCRQFQRISNWEKNIQRCRDKFFAHGYVYRGRMGKWLMLHNYRSRQIHRNWNRDNQSSSSSDKSFSPMSTWPWHCTTTDQNDPIELQRKSIQWFQRHWTAAAQMTDVTLDNYRCGQFYTSNKENSFSHFGDKHFHP